MRPSPHPRGEGAASKSPRLAGTASGTVPPPSTPTPAGDCRVSPCWRGALGPRGPPLLGPRPELAYNEAVNAVNKEQFKAAKEHLTKAIALDPNFADSYYLMGIVEFSLNNPKAARASFLKYQEKAPNGSKKAEVKEFLKELK